jgi:hypothetical protein
MTHETEMVRRQKFEVFLSFKPQTSNFKSCLSRRSCISRTLLGIRNDVRIRFLHPFDLVNLCDHHI